MPSIIKLVTCLLSIVLVRCDGLNTDGMMHTSSLLINNTLLAFDSNISGKNIASLRKYTLDLDHPDDIVSIATMADTHQDTIYYETRFLSIITGDSNSKFTYLFGSLNNNSPKSLVSKVNINNLQVVQDFDLMTSPNFTAFPAYEFSSNLLYIPTNNASSMHPALFLFGGLWRPSNGTDPIPSNQIVSYDYQSKSWKDLSFSSKNSSVPFISGHDSVAVDSRYLYILGGTTIIGNEAKMNDLANLWVFDTFTNSWSTKSTTNSNPKMELNKLGRVGFSSSIYKDSIVIYGGSTSSPSSPYNHHLGQLNLTTMQWDWVDMTYGTDQKLSITYHDSQIVGDTLLLIHGQRSSNSPDDPVFVIDIPSKEFVTKSLHTTDTHSQSSLPVYAIVLMTIAICSALLLIIFLLYRYVWRTRFRSKIAEYPVTDEAFKTDKELIKTQMSRTSFMEQSPHNSIYIPRQLSIITSQLCNLNEQTDLAQLDGNGTTTSNDTSLVLGDVSTETGITVVRTDGDEIQMTNERITRGKVIKGQEIELR